MTTCYLVKHCIEWEGCTNESVFTDEDDAQALVVELGKDIEPFSDGYYMVEPITLNPDPVETSRKFGEVG